jgi:hypothetical protein
MRFIKARRATALMAVCALVGAAAGINGAGAATTKSKQRSASTSQNVRPPRDGRGGPGVHASVVRLDKAGDAFVTVTEGDGIVKSVTGDQLTITEGTKTVTYKDEAITVGSDATVYRNGAKAAIGDLKVGDHVHVSQSSDGTFVFAGDAAHRPGLGHHGPGGDGDGDGPPPSDQ